MCNRDRKRSCQVNQDDIYISGEHGERNLGYIITCINCSCKKKVVCSLVECSTKVKKDGKLEKIILRT